MAAAQTDLAGIVVKILEDVADKTQGLKVAMEAVDDEFLAVLSSVRAETRADLAVGPVEPTEKWFDETRSRRNEIVESIRQRIAAVIVVDEVLAECQAAVAE